MPRKKNTRKAIQAARRAEANARNVRTPKVGIIAHKPSGGIGMAMMATALLRHGNHLTRNGQ